MRLLSRSRGPLPLPATPVPHTLIICLDREPGSSKWQIPSDRKPKKEVEQIRGFMWPGTGSVAWTEDPSEKTGLLEKVEKVEEQC